MERLFVFLIIFLFHQITLSQVNLNLDIDVRQLTPMKLSDISEESHYVAFKMDSIVDFFAADNFLFVTTGGFFPTILHQYDLSGNIIRTIHNDKKFAFRVDSKNNRLIHGYVDKLEFWNYNGAFLNDISLPEQTGSDSNSIIGIDQNNIWILYQNRQSEKVACRICRLNTENGRMETVLERDLPVPNIPFHYKVCYSSFGGKSYISFPDNVIYEVDGKSVRPAVKYSIRNYRDELTHLLHDSRFAGRYLVVKYGSTIAKYMIFWYDTKEKRTWQMKIDDWVGGIEDDIFQTGTCDNYQIQGNFLVFRKQSNDLPEEMNVEKDHTVIFITKLKQ